MTQFRFIYFSHSTLQIPRVARQCTVALCEGAAASGVDSEIVSISVRLNEAEPSHAPFEQLYQLEFPVRHTACALPFVGDNERGRLSSLLRLAWYTGFAFRLAIKTRKASGERTILSARNFSVLAMLAVLKRFLGLPWVVLADVHGPCTTRFQRWVHRLVDGNVCISRHLSEHLQQTCGLSPDRVRVAHSGVKPARFRSEMTKNEAAALLGLNRDKPILCYTGKVYYRYEEVAYLLQIAEALRDEVKLVVVGGRPDQIPPWQAECVTAGINNVVFTGFQAPSRVPLYLRAADLLLLYYSPSPLNDFRSPGKLFEYLASGTPLVSNRFKGIEEVVREGDNGFLVAPYRPECVAARIRELLADRTGWERIGQRGIETANQYTWKHRAAAFLQYASELRGETSQAKEPADLVVSRTQPVPKCHGTENGDLAIKKARASV